MKKRYIEVLKTLDFVHPIKLDTSHAILDSLRRMSLHLDLKKMRKIPVNSRVRGYCSACDQNLVETSKVTNAEINALKDFFEGQIRQSPNFCQEIFEEHMKLFDSLGSHDIIVDFANYSNYIPNLHGLLEKIFNDYPSNRVLFVAKNYHENILGGFTTRYPRVNVLRLNNL